MRCTIATALLCTLPGARAGVSKHVMAWRGLIRPELIVPDIRPAIISVLKEPSSCVPDGAVTLSVINKHHARMRADQFALMKDQPCFMNRMVSVCYNVTDTFGTCVHSLFAIPPSDFRRSNYANLIWAKWRIIADALQVARVAMWVDADVLLLRNPWTGIDAASAVAYDIRYQSETRCGERECDALRSSCSTLNGGQLLVSSRQLAERIYKLRPQNLTNTADLDQDLADEVIRGNGTSVSYCPLPGSYFAQCWLIKKASRDERRSGRTSAPMLPLCERLTHHYNCVTSRKGKAEEMKGMLREWKKRCS